mmetsp:Transcript_2233/g.8631  ORF Transcript_2233/g.8631 Transcript_2233/m.8631 type:complete len:244 (-) Transcript_2233:832-1563(-)
MVLSKTTSAQVMRFWVRVPVLSEQMQVVEPSVSTDSMFFTSTFLLNMALAVRESDTVTVASRPSGTLATMMPIMNTRLVMGSVPSAKPMMKKVMPRKMATADTMLMKWWISLLIGVSSLAVPSVSWAILPMKVSSPVRTTTPTADLFFASVPKNTMLVASLGSVSVLRRLRSSTSGSPVRGELSTPKPSPERRRMSAGIFLPWFRYTTSPGTRYLASKCSEELWQLYLTQLSTSLSFPASVGR